MHCVKNLADRSQSAKKRNIPRGGASMDVMWCGVRHVLLYAAELGHISSDIKYYTAGFLPISASRCGPSLILYSPQPRPLHYTLYRVGDRARSLYLELKMML